MKTALFLLIVITLVLVSSGIVSQIVLISNGLTVGMLRAGIRLFSMLVPPPLHVSMCEIALLNHHPLFVL